MAAIETITIIDHNQQNQHHHHHHHHKQQLVQVHDGSVKMCARLLACPLCSQPGFNTLDSLRAGLVSVATRALACPVCNEILMGIDKLTIHLFGHTIYSSVNSHNNSNNNNNNSHHQNNHNGNDHRGSNGQHCVEPKIVELQQATRGPSGNTIWIEGNTATAAGNVCPDNGGKLLNGNDGASIFIPIEEIENFRTVMKDASSNGNEQQDQHHLIGNTNQTVVLQNIGGAGSQQSQKIYSANLLPVNTMAGADFANDKIGKESYTQTDWSKSSNEQQQQLESRTDMLAELVKNAQITASPFPVGNYEPMASDSNNIGNDDNHHRIDDDNDQVVEVAASAKPIITSQRLLAKDERPERCDICGFGFPDLKILLLHKQIAHRVPEAQARLGPEQLHMKNFPCHLCSKVFTIKGSLMVHMKVAHPGVNRPVNPGLLVVSDEERVATVLRVASPTEPIIAHKSPVTWIFTKFERRSCTSKTSSSTSRRTTASSGSATCAASSSPPSTFSRSTSGCTRARCRTSAACATRPSRSSSPITSTSSITRTRSRTSARPAAEPSRAVDPAQSREDTHGREAVRVSQRTHKCVPSSNSTATASGSNADSSAQAAATATFQSEGDNATVYPDVNPNNNNNSNSSSGSNFLLLASSGKEQALKRKLEAEIENEDGSSTLHQQQNNRSMMLVDGGGSSSRSNDDFANLCWATTTTASKSRDEPKENEITILAVINDKQQTTTVWPGKKMLDSPSTDDSLMKELDKVSEDYRSGVWSLTAASQAAVQSSPSSEMMRSLSLAEVTTIANNKSSDDCCDDYFAPLADHPNAVAVVEQQQQQQRDNDDTSMTTTAAEVSMMNDDNNATETARGVGVSSSSLSTLQTINEDSLKELLNMRRRRAKRSRIRTNMSTVTSSSSSRTPIITVTPVHDPIDQLQPTTPPAKPPRAAGHHPRSIAFRDVVTRDEAAWLARRCLGEGRPPRRVLPQALLRGEDRLSGPASAPRDRGQSPKRASRGQREAEPVREDGTARSTQPGGLHRGEGLLPQGERLFSQLRRADRPRRRRWRRSNDEKLVPDLLPGQARRARVRGPATAGLRQSAAHVRARRHEVGLDLSGPVSRLVAATRGSTGRAAARRDVSAVTGGDRVQAQRALARVVRQRHGPGGASGPRTLRPRGRGRTAPSRRHGVRHVSGVARQAQRRQSRRSLVVESHVRRWAEAVPPRGLPAAALRAPQPRSRPAAVSLLDARLSTRARGQDDRAVLGDSAGAFGIEVRGPEAVARGDTARLRGAEDAGLRHRGDLSSDGADVGPRRRADHERARDLRGVLLQEQTALREADHGRRQGVRGEDHGGRRGARRDVAEDRRYSQADLIESL
ncbi:unnamed protein product [Trichogramma brassicae]|uniref:C2H2-type domain-containing protein n=1 Tax=Trichogramma brassicae TaxID=86971 RepID=A0A6H5ID89_9HYME|nr:unnamed protein product [Trichogramma brassicae]